MTFTHRIQRETAAVKPVLSKHHREGYNCLLTASACLIQVDLQRMLLWCMRFWPFKKGFCFY